MPLCCCNGDVTAGFFDQRTAEHSSYISIAICQHSVSNNHPKANIFHFKIIDLDNKQATREAREAIHIRINNPALNHNMGKMYIAEIFNNLLEADGSTNKSNPLGDSDPTKSHSLYCSNRFARTVCLANQVS